jgi:hypothetical protein
LSFNNTGTIIHHVLIYVGQSNEHGAKSGRQRRNRGEALAPRERQAQTPAPPPRLSARSAEIYKEKVAGLEVSLNDPSIRHEAAEALRGY